MSTTSKPGTVSISNTGDLGSVVGTTMEDFTESFVTCVSKGLTGESSGTKSRGCLETISSLKSFCFFIGGGDGVRDEEDRVDAIESDRVLLEDAVEDRRRPDL